MKGVDGKPPYKAGVETTDKDATARSLLLDNAASSTNGGDRSFFIRSKTGLIGTFHSVTAPLIFRHANVEVVLPVPVIKPPPPS